MAIQGETRGKMVDWILRYGRYLDMTRFDKNLARKGGSVPFWPIVPVRRKGGTMPLVVLTSIERGSSEGEQAVERGHGQIDSNTLALITYSPSRQGRQYKWRTPTREFHI